jgi:hypothetical protein
VKQFCPVFVFNCRQNEAISKSENGSYSGGLQVSIPVLIISVADPDDFCPDPGPTFQIV